MSSACCICSLVVLYTRLSVKVNLMFLRAEMFSMTASATSRLGMFHSVPSRLRILVLRKPTASTVPRLPFTSITSPTLKTSSLTIDSAPKMLAIVFCAAKAIASPTTPAPVSSAATLK